MKKFFPFITVCLGLMLAVSCEKIEVGNINVNEDIPLKLTMPDGFKTVSSVSDSEGSEDTDGKSDLSFSRATFKELSDKEGCIHLSAFTNGRMVHDSFYMSFYLKRDSLRPGKEPEFESILFCLPLSSDSRSYTDSFSGHIYLKEYSSEKVTLRFKKTVFEIGQGAYKLDGDLTFVAGELTD